MSYNPEWRRVKDLNLRVFYHALFSKQARLPDSGNSPKWRWVQGSNSQVLPRSGFQDQSPATPALPTIFGTSTRTRTLKSSFGGCRVSNYTMLVSKMVALVGIEPTRSCDGSFTDF